ncbi:MAG: acyltransferase [Xanthobacteraceae bacterium]|jgi:peptidoglycan/LPS O-acetylase OafA/YrhL
MFGQLRFLLAYLVVISHLVGTAYVAHFGFYAVVGFFIVAGFFMTSALNEVYRFDGIGFCINRALRLLPPYFMVSAITLVVVAAMPNEAGQFLKFWRADMGLRDVLLNLVVLPLQTPDPTFRMVPPFWSIAIEIEMYLALYLVMARNLGWAFIAFVVGLSYHLAGAYTGLPWAAHYFTAPSAVLPFAAGALIYFIRQQESWAVAPWIVVTAFLAWLANMLAGGWAFSDSYIFGLGYYVGVALFTVVVAGLAGRRFGPTLERVDRMLGEWSYSIFLVQWLTGFVVAVTFTPGQWRGWTLLVVATPAIIAAGAGLAILNRRLVEPLRDLVRTSSARRQNPTAKNIPAKPTIALS